MCRAARCLLPLAPCSPRCSTRTDALLRSPPLSSALLRSPRQGLGWLLTRKLWEELGPKWPNEAGFWDDWLREAPQRRGRASIRPEVSRTFTFGSQGTSVGLFYRKYLANIELNAKPVDFGTIDLRYLLKDEYDAKFQRWVGDARVVHSIDSARREAAAGGASGGGGGDIKVHYRDKAEFIRFCKALGLMEDLKAGIPRTAYHGVVLVRINGRRVFLAPSYRVDQEIIALPPPGK